MHTAQMAAGPLTQKPGSNPSLRLTHPITLAEVLQSLQAYKMDLRALGSYMERLK